MEVLTSQQINIYPHQPRRIIPCETDFVNQSALYRLYRGTISPSNYLTYPLQIRTHLARDLVTGDSESYGLCVPYPYCFRYDPKLSRFARDPMYGADLYINLAACENPDANIIDIINESSDINPILLAANYTFMHEWRHLIKLAEGGFAYYSKMVNRCNNDCLFKVKACPPDTCLLDEYEDEDCEVFATEQTLKIVRKESLPVIKRIP